MWGACFLALWLLGPLGAVAQKPSPALSFAVASVKPIGRDSLGRSLLRLHKPLATQHFDLACTLRQAISWAYGVEENQVQFPESLRSQMHSLYHFEAEPSGRATEGQRRIMLQRLLAQRFKLAVRAEHRVVSGYSLIVAKGGPKNLRPMPPFDPRDPNAGTEGLTMTQFAEDLHPGPNGFELLSPDAKDVMPVVDATGIKGTYDLSPGPFGHAFLSPAIAPFMQPPGVTAVPLASLLEEKIGLTLVRAKVVSETLITVTHVEPLAPN